MSLCFSYFLQKLYGFDHLQFAARHVLVLYLNKTIAHPPSIFAVVTGLENTLHNPQNVFST